VKPCGTPGIATAGWYGATGGGRGLEVVPGGVGLLPHEHYKRTRQLKPLEQLHKGLRKQEAFNALDLTLIGFPRTTNPLPI
jgi:hypothetical protein